MTYADQTILKDLEFSKDGYMTDIDAWTPEIGEAIAIVFNITLLERHWGIVNYSRKIYLQEEKNVSVRRLMRDLGIEYQDIFDLFPGLPVRTIAKIAGLPKPVGCV